MDSFALGHAKFLSVMLTARVHPYYVLHVRSHTNLPGFVAEGLNPRGLKALELWQTDATQVAEFGGSSMWHVTVDTFSSAMWVSAHAGEKACNVIAHWRQAFAVLGIPSAVKTNNGPAYASQKASDDTHQPRAKVRVQNLVTKQWDGPYDLIAMGHGDAQIRIAILLGLVIMAYRKLIKVLEFVPENPSAVGLLKVEEQRVPIATSTVHHRQYRTTRDAVIPIHKMICELETQGVVSKTHSPFNSPIWPVRKSDREWRLTVDYRALNKVTPPLITAVPDMLELQYELESKAAKWYATIDIANAFFSIRLSVECRPQFAFT
ncbi:hypothetical protein DUI87_01425 [Hirundo rustica rustica]|uniref:ribonuclease H n=1 Tax=Hirundo rustica rustica TaxID=333673 RepID=A0A3M0L9D3_HIRRU|nr:hypothetical protein DUI87_01425 [Hirundo rustica rustica]